MEKSAFGFVENGKVIRAAFGAHEALVIGEVNTTEEESIAYFEEKFNRLAQEVSEIAEKIESQDNKGSFLSKVTHLKNSLPTFEGLGDFTAIESTLDELLEKLNEYIEQNRQKNLQIKTALLEQLKLVAASHEWKTASAQVKEVQQKWIKTGAVAEEQRANIEGEFKAIIDDFYKRRNAFYEDLNKMMEEREADYEAFVISAKSLLEIKELDKLRQAIHEKQEEWQSLGKIKPAKHSEYWEKFQGLIKKAFKSAKKETLKLSGGNPKEQLAKLASFSDKLQKANKELIPAVDYKALQQEWRALQKIKHKTAIDIKQSIRFQMEMLSEKNFISTLVEKRKGKSTDLKLRQKISRDLLERDKRELNNFQENLGKFSLKGGLDNMLTKKLQQQEQKVEIKKTILNQIREQLA